MSEAGRFRYSLNQLFITWQRARARSVEGARLRATLAGAGLWLALFPPSSPAPLTRLAPQLQLHLTARGVMWSLSLSLVIMVIPWRWLTRPLPSELPPPLKLSVPALLGPALWRGLRVLSWELPALLIALAAGWMGLQATLGLSAWPFPWAAPSTALLPPALLGLGAYLDISYLKTRASRARFVEQFQRWHQAHPLEGLLDKPRMQLPHPEHQGGLYDEEVRKILIVDQDLTVDILAKNGLHKRDSFLLLSLQGYPEPAAKFARRLLALHGAEVEVFVLHSEQRAEEQLNQQLKALSVTARHRVVKIGWRRADLRRLIAHLGFKPLDWSVFAVDTLSPKNLLEGVASALALGAPLSARLLSGGGVLPAPPKPKRAEPIARPKPASPRGDSDPQLESFLTPSPSAQVQGKALKARGGEEA